MNVQTKALHLHALIALALIIAPLPLWAAQDAEEATHDESAARLAIVDTYKYSGFEVIQIDLGVLAHYSYLLVSEGKALLVDPMRDVQFYFETAKERNFTIMGTFLTHNHADFVAGHLEAAKLTKKPIYISAQAGVDYPHHPLTEKSELKVGKATLRFLDTPGHTPESMCGLVYGAESDAKPEVMFSGDTVFVGSLGRPDLMGGTVSASWLASKMFDTWFGKLSKLPDDVVVLPAHGAGSLCGAHLSDDPTSTIGREKATNPYLKHETRSAFIAAILDGLPEAPQYFGHNAKMNKAGPALVDWESLPPSLDPHRDLMDPAKYYVVDLRDSTEYAKGHIPNSVNVALRGRVETWTGIMVPWGSNLVLTGSDKELREGVKRLHRIGYQAKGVITYEDWARSKLPVRTNDRVEPKVLHDKMKDGSSPVIVDVRLPKEWMASKIGQVVNLPLNELAALSTKLDKEEPVVTVCNSAFRSSLSVGILERQGFTKVASLAGGGEAWKKAGLPMIKATVPGHGSSPEAYRVIRLPERMSADALKRTLMDLPGSVEVVDLRPADQFSDYHIPHSHNADVVDVMNSPTYLVGTVPLVLVSRDGSVAMAVGGALAQKTERPIKVLFGGVQAYWKGTMNLQTSPLPAVLAPSSSPSSPKPANPKPAVKPQKRRRRSAGC